MIFLRGCLIGVVEKQRTTTIVSRGLNGNDRIDRHFGDDDDDATLGNISPLHSLYSDVSCPKKSPSLRFWTRTKVSVLAFYTLGMIKFLCLLLAISYWLLWIIIMWTSIFGWRVRSLSVNLLLGQAVVSGQELGVVDLKGRVLWNEICPSMSYRSLDTWFQA